MLGADLAAYGAVIPRKKAVTVGAFIKVGAVKLLIVVKRAKHSSHIKTPLVDY
jgi:hypothetical protein